MQMVGAFAEFERAMLKERTKAGLDAARQEGRIGGRRPKLSDQQQSEIRKMITKGDKTAADAARLFKVHPATVSRLLARPNSRNESRVRWPTPGTDFWTANSATPAAAREASRRCRIRPVARRLAGTHRSQKLLHIRHKPDGPRQRRQFAIVHLNPKCALIVPHIGAFMRSCKGPGGATCAGATRSPDAMNEVFRVLRQIVVHDMRDIIHMNPARRHVGGDQYTVNTIFEALQRFVPLALRAVAVDRGHPVFPALQKFREPVGALFGMPIRAQSWSQAMSGFATTRAAPVASPPQS